MKVAVHRIVQLVYARDERSKTIRYVDGIPWLKAYKRKLKRFIPAGTAEVIGGLKLGAGIECVELI